mgnify:CR=1 FL=1
MGWLRGRRRARLMGRGLPEEWRRIVRRNVPYDHGVCTYSYIVPDLYGTENLCPRTDHHIVSYFGMSAFGLSSCSS